MNNILLNSMLRYGDRDVYDEILRNENYNEVSACYEFRKWINQSKIEIIKMEDLTNNINDKELLVTYIQELFLEYIDVVYLRDIERVMNQNGWSWSDVYGEHIKHPNKRLWRIISIRRN